jgi:excisionase family DNA binding protein
MGASAHEIILGKVWPGMAWLGLAGRGSARLGKARGRMPTDSTPGGDDTMTDLPNKPLLRADEVAPFLRVTRKTIYLWVQEGKLQGYKVNGVVRIPRSGVLKFIIVENT